MVRLRILALAAASMCSGSAAAQLTNGDPNSLQSLSGLAPSPPPYTIGKRGFSFRMLNYVDPRGVVQQRQGIIAGRQIAPGTILGVGIFRTAPKMRGYVGDIPQNVVSRRSKRAAVGLTMKF